jgi:excisionase family DNA binding protein
MLRCDADRALSRRLAGIANEIIDYLLERQGHSPMIQVEQAYIPRWASRYRRAVINEAVSYAAKLAETIGLKKGIGPRDVRWIVREFGAFIRRHTSGDEPATFVSTSSAGIAEIQSPEEVDDYFSRALTRYKKIPSPMRDVRSELLKPQEIYGRTKKSRRESGTVRSATPAEMVKNPGAFPTMTCKQVAELLQISRSTVARWVYEGKLARGGSENASGKRARMLIKTESVRKYLDENKV